MSKKTVYDFSVRANFMQDLPDNTIKAEVPVIQEKMTLDEFIDAFKKYSENFSNQEKMLYTMGRMIARTTKNKRDFNHYFLVFSQIYFRNLISQLPDLQNEITAIEEKVIAVRKELANVLKDVKVDDTGMIPYTIGMTEGLL